MKPRLPRGSTVVARLFFAAFLVLDLYLPAWARMSLSEEPVEQSLSLVPPEEPPAEYPDEAKIFHFDQERWNRARDAIDRGESPAVEAPVASTDTAPTELPKVEAPGIEVELPYESGLSISGRKLISLKLRETRYKSAQRARDLGVSKVQHDFEMEQQLQVRIKGQVGRKITVNVDFDDTRDDKRDISVVYKGDPEELVQEAAFGDITLSLPSTEFVSYSKQLFGVSARLKYKRAEMYFIGSRAKGVTETKRFSGGTEFEHKEINDTAYIRKRYYQLSFDPSHLPLVDGSEEIWLDDRDPTNDIPGNTQPFTVEDFAVNTSTYGGQFDRLQPGVHYSIDVTKGIITFRNALADNSVVAVNYTTGGGFRLADPGQDPGPGRRMKVLKTVQDQPLFPAQAATEVGYRRELKTFYSIGRQKIIRDNGRGNFILRTIDLNRNPITVVLSDNSSLIYPISGVTQDDVDFENGVFRLTPPLTVDDPTLYDPVPTHKFTFLLEYRYRLKSYLIKPNIVVGSEHVSLNGRLLTRDVDYIIDYDSGFLSFFNEDSIDETSQIEVTYEVAPFGGQLGQTLVGTREELSLIPGKVFLGSTMLYTFDPKPTIVPDVRSAPSSLLVLEGDGRADSIKIPFTPLTMSVSGEVAQSRQNPNLFGRALIDSMEGIKLEDGVILDQRFWQIAANPTGGGAVQSNTLSLGDADAQLLDINPRSNARKGDSQRILTVGYNLASKAGFPATPEQTSFVQALSRSGRDFSKKRTLEVWVHGAGAGGQDIDVTIDAGSFNEDADGDGVLDNEDQNFDGTLNEGEDDGWTFNNTGPDGLRNTSDDSASPIGAGNGRIDTEDLDADGGEDFIDITPRAFPLFQLSDVPTSPTIKMYDPVTGTEDPHGDLNFSGWRIIQVPLDIAPSEATNFQGIKQVRVTLTGGPGGAPRSGQFFIGKIGFVGNRWEDAGSVGGSTMTVAAINNIDDPAYVSLIGNSAYNDLYKTDSAARLKEQALALRYELPVNSTTTTRVTYPTPKDFSQHKSLKFFVRVPSGKALGATLFVQMGSETDYFSYNVPLGPEHVDNWVVESANLADLNNDGNPDVLVAREGATVTAVGNPKLTDIGQIKIGLHNPAAGSPITGDDGEVWINEIHLTGAREKVGLAQRVSADFNWPLWGTFGGKFRDVDRNFQTITSPVTNQDRTENSAYVTFSRLRFMPLSANYSDSLTLTPAAIRTGESGLVSVLQEGRVFSRTGSAQGSLIFSGLPSFSYGYTKNYTDSNLLKRYDDRDSYNANASYSLPWKPDFLPGSFFTLRPLPDSVDVSYRRSNYFLSFYPEKKQEEVFSSTTSTTTVRESIFNNARTLEFTDDWSVRTGFTPWEGFTLNPTVAWKRVRERKIFTEDDHARTNGDFRPMKSYKKAYAQSLNLSASLRVFRWLEPRLTYNLSGSETNNLPTASSPTAFNLKSITRTGDGEASWAFSMRDLFPNFKLTQSLSFNNSFQTSSGDAYNNVNQEFTDWTRFDLFRVKRVRRKNGKSLFGLLAPLAPENTEAQRQQLTLRNTFRTSQSWSPLDWMRTRVRFQPFSTLNLTSTYFQSDEHSEAASTVSDKTSITSPDIVLSMRDLEKLYGLTRWMDNSRLNIRTSRKKNETFGETSSRTKDLGIDHSFTLWKAYDVFISATQTGSEDVNLKTGILTSKSDGLGYSLQVGMQWGVWRLTPSYNFKTDQAEDGAGKKTQDLTTNSYSVKARMDKAYPEGFKIPFTDRVFGNINRLIVDTGLTFDQKKSSLNVERDNTDVYTGNLSGEYEISRNFRLSFGGDASYHHNRKKSDEDFIAYGITSTLTIQF